MNNFSFKLMRFASLFTITRMIGIKVSTFKKKSKLEDDKTISILSNPKDYLTDIVENGFSRKFIIPKELLSNIIKYCDNNKFLDIKEGSLHTIDYEIPTKPNSSGLWYQHNDAYNLCPDVKRLAHNHDILKIIREYLGAEPLIKSVAIWWSFPPDNSNYNHEYGFHYDIDAYKFIKFFIYLVDVDENTGPHSIIPSTHKSKNFFEKRNRRLTDDQVKSRYSDKKIVTVLGKAGDGFFEDTFTYHKGTTPKKPRLMLQVEYSL